jgi:Carboxypeptidase regulatory-like domain
MTKTTRRVLLVAAVLIAAIAVTVFVMRERIPRPLAIAGRTVGPGGEPLAGVVVVLEVAPGDSEEESAVERVETRSDAKGEFSINFLGHWNRATYRLEAQKPGFDKISVEDAGSLKNPVILRFAPPRS